jgi:long-chain acyl-CoA synthetase
MRKPGSVGKPLRQNKVRIADDGEILVRGPGVAKSSERSGSDDDTEARLLHTGDLGRVDSDGFLYLSGRRSEIIKTSAGRWLVPTEIEGRMTRLADVRQAVVLAAARQGTTILIALEDGVKAQPHRTLQSADSPRPVPASATRHAELSMRLAHELADLPAHQRCAALIVASANDLSVEGGHLTTNLKLRRQRIADHFSGSVEAIRRALADAPVKTSGSILVVDLTRSSHPNGER